MREIRKIISEFSLKFSLHLHTDNPGRPRSLAGMNVLTKNLRKIGCFSNRNKWENWPEPIFSTLKGLLQAPKASCFIAKYSLLDFILEWQPLKQMKCKFFTWISRHLIPQEENHVNIMFNSIYYLEPFIHYDLQGLPISLETIWLQLYNEFIKFLTFSFK